MAIFCSQFSFTSCTTDQAKKGLLIHVVYNEHCPQISVVVQCSAYPEEFHIKQHLKFLLQISDVLCPLHSLSKILVICSTMKTTPFANFLMHVSVILKLSAVLEYAQHLRGKENKCMPQRVFMTSKYSKYQNQ